jgi:hypothetical protein
VTWDEIEKHFLRINQARKHLPEHPQTTISAKLLELLPVLRDAMHDGFEWLEPDIAMLSIHFRLPSKGVLLGVGSSDGDQIIVFRIINSEYVPIFASANVSEVSQELLAILLDSSIGGDLHEE